MKLNNDIVKLFEIFSKNKYKLYIIGGAVRNYLLGKSVDDYDFCTSATPNQMVEILDCYKLDTYQSELGSVKVHINNKVYEITTFRKELGIKDLRYPNRTIFVNNLEEDILRRDFTINTLAYNLIDGIVDYLGGINDLNNKKIKFVKDTSISINEDPIRLIRALRFSLLLDFNVSSSDLNIFNKNAYLVSKLGKIKYTELLKLFKIKGCKKFILKHFEIYKQAYIELDNEYFIKILNSDIEEDLLKYIVAVYINDDNLLDFNKNDKLIMKGLKSIETDNEELYYTKLLMIEYKSLLDIILYLDKYLNSRSSKIIDNINLIKKERHCLDVRDLKITYLDLEKLNVNQKDYTKVFKYLLELVLKDNSLNTYEQLLTLVEKIKVSL